MENHNYMVYIADKTTLVGPGKCLENEENWAEGSEHKYMEVIS